MLLDGASCRLTDSEGTSLLCHARDAETAKVEFYQSIFGWKVRERGDGSTAFDDTTGHVSGTWVTGRPPSEQPGLLIYVMVDSLEASVRAAIAQGAEIVQSIGADAPEITARFRDPGGNVLGLY